MSKKIQRVILSLDERLARAHMHLDKGVYHLGHGGRHPEDVTEVGPFDHDDEQHPGKLTADCSGYIAWVVGMDRFQQRVLPGLSEENEDGGGVWFNCQTIIKDSGNKVKYFYRRVPRTEEVKVGDILVYPPHDSKRYGHVGIITALTAKFADARRVRKGWGREATISHCSTGNGGVAVRLSDAGVFERDGHAYTVRLLAPDGGDAA